MEREPERERETLVGPRAMAAVDRAAGALGPALMANAGRAVARAARAGFQPCRVLVLCGPGKNGGDGYVAARLLSAQGWPVAVAAFAPPSGEAAAAAAGWAGPTVTFAPAEAARAGLVVDAVFGAGLARDLPERVAATLAASGGPILAVDVPSGLDGGTGQARGAVSPAALTVTFERRKPGHLLLPGRELCGETLVAAIGMPPAAFDAAPRDLWRNGPWLWSLPGAGTQSHKYTRGTVTVLGGASMTGAARLAAMAAQRAGAGLTRIAAQDGAAIYRAGEPGVIVTEAPLAALLAETRPTVWVCGPGLGADSAASALDALRRAGARFLADADALGAAAGDPGRLRGAAVITPHAGEFARVFGAPGADRLAAARAAAARIGAVVVLKGADSVIAAPDGRAAINDSAPPWLATAGAGDVLAGLVASLLAQGMAPFEAAAAGVWLHGRAAAQAGEGLVAADLPGGLAAAFAEARRPPASRLSREIGRPARGPAARRRPAAWG